MARLRDRTALAEGAAAAVVVLAEDTEVAMEGEEGLARHLLPETGGVASGRLVVGMEEEAEEGGLTKVASVPWSAIALGEIDLNKM